jgi:outer membrane scaffolding protein for murein synthesis (MipA/OmpV family)
VTFADETYMNSYFGINAYHAIPHSHFAVYHATGGLKNTNFGISTDYRFEDSPWSLHGTIGVERVMGSAATSPIVQEKWQLGNSVDLLYKF